MSVGSGQFCIPSSTRLVFATNREQVRFWPYLAGQGDGQGPTRAFQDSPRAGPLEKPENGPWRKGLSRLPTQRSLSTCNSIVPETLTGLFIFLTPDGMILRYAKAYLLRLRCSDRDWMPICEIEKEEGNYGSRSNFHRQNAARENLKFSK